MLSKEEALQCVRDSGMPKDKKKKAKKAIRGMWDYVDVSGEGLIDEGELAAVMNGNEFAQKRPKGTHGP